MSHDAHRWAMRQRGIGPGPRWVVVCLAGRMNHRTGKCFPSLATLAADTGFSEDTVRRHLQALVVAGLIDIERTEGGSNAYRLRLSAGRRRRGMEGGAAHERA